MLHTRSGTIFIHFSKIIPDRGRKSIEKSSPSCLATGVYGYPIEEATAIALRETRAFLSAHPDQSVTFCCFSSRDAEVYRRLS